MFLMYISNLLAPFILFSSYRWVANYSQSDFLLPIGSMLIALASIFWFKKYTKKYLQVSLLSDTFVGNKGLDGMGLLTFKLVALGSLFMYLAFSFAQQDMLFLVLEISVWVFFLPKVLLAERIEINRGKDLGCVISTNDTIFLIKTFGNKLTGSIDRLIENLSNSESFNKDDFIKGLIGLLSTKYRETAKGILFENRVNSLDYIEDLYEGGLFDNFNDKTNANRIITLIEGLINNKKQGIARKIWSKLLAQPSFVVEIKNSKKNKKSYINSVIKFIELSLDLENNKEDKNKGVFKI